MGLVGVAELAVYLVGVDEEVVLAGYVSEFFDLILGVEHSCGVAGIADDDTLCAGSDVFLELLDGGDGEAVVHGSGDGHELHVVDDGEGIVVGVERLQHDDLVVGVAGDREGYLKGLAAACSYVDVGVVYVDADVLVILCQTLAVGLIAGRVGVGHELELIVLYGLESLDRRCYVGLSDVEVVYFYASFLGGISIGNEFPYGRCGQCLSFFRKCQHDIFC